VTRRGRCRGFTLLEVVVALALLSLLVSVVYGGFATAVKAYEAAEQRGDASARLRSVSEFLRRSLGGAFPLAIASGGNWELAFEGGRDRLRFVADLPAWVGVGGLHELVLESDGRGEDGQLVLRRRPLVVGRDGAIDGDYEDHVLLESLSSLRLRYFGSVDRRAPREWRDDWPAGQRMPELVELRLADAASGDWPPVRVRPRVDTVRYQNADAPREPRPGQARTTPAAAGRGDAAEPETER
jgi:general secretion pathway protein J